MNRNILLSRMKIKRKIEPKKNTNNNNDDKNLNIINKNKNLINNNILDKKYNPDIPLKFQKDKHIRGNLIKPSNFKINNNKIKENKEDLSKKLQEIINDRNKKLAIEKKVSKKRIITPNVTNFYQMKTIVNELKKENEERIKIGKETNDAILSYYT